MYFLAEMHCACGRPECPGDDARIVDDGEAARLSVSFMRSFAPAADNPVSVSEDSGSLILRSDRGDFLMLTVIPEAGTVN